MPNDVQGGATVPQNEPDVPVLKIREVPEDKRFCWKCHRPVGRGDQHGPGPLRGACGQCGAPFNFRAALREGEVVADQYEITGCLAYGGVGWVFLARDRHVGGRWVVLKGLQNPQDIDAHLTALVERQFLSELAHPGIVEIYNFVTHRSGDGTTSGYIVMEYVVGRSLDVVLEQRAPEPLPVADAISYVLEILPALDYIHTHRLAYNDLKPANIMVGQDEVRLIDLGAVSALQSGGSLYGTPGYQAPEVTSTGPTVASDIYTVGRTLAALTLPGRCVGSLPEDAPVLRRYPAFAKLLYRATAEDPARRFPSVAALSDQLRGVLRMVRSRDGGGSDPHISTVFGSVRSDFCTNDGFDAAELAAALPIPLIDSDDSGWRIDWYDGITALTTGRLAQAYERFDHVGAMVPGELAPLLALAATAELRAADAADQRQRQYWYRLATGHYRTVWQADHTVVAAAFGLARQQLRDGDTGAAISVVRQLRKAVPHNDLAPRFFAQLVALLQLADITQRLLDEAAAGLAALPAGPHVLELRVAVLQSALDWLCAGGEPGSCEDSIFGHPYTERGLRCGLEAALRELAFATPDRLARFALVDRANAVRVRTRW
ncbi:serine/threonine-protein kinase [Nocardia xishanensis]|uniref:serine/threonine-protein kinase n=1 Tax=Nocardia xishanensis TaxID=238964 RepID=UPI00082A6126|nr:serine/threonine-protein kinase [Nocardia xishanensis]